MIILDVEPGQRGRDVRACRNDLKRDECLRLAVRAAFPLPKTGAFEDLLLALDEAVRKT